MAHSKNSLLLAYAIFLRPMSSSCFIYIYIAVVFPFQFFFFPFRFECQILPWAMERLHSGFVLFVGDKSLERIRPTWKLLANLLSVSFALGFSTRTILARYFLFYTAVTIKVHKIAMFVGHCLLLVEDLLKQFL